MRTKPLPHGQNVWWRWCGGWEILCNTGYVLSDICLTVTLLWDHLPCWQYAILSAILVCVLLFQIVHCRTEYGQVKESYQS